ncbi:RimJ/RimL family protein N-acetyltransferase [Agromyces cerinus]|uniref:GNAT family N-acetyltransferase n=1 Tax=Agromyces cerinus TaxID=33878 RepID=UPI0027DD8E58|nr:GNAT family protein [Agromyces cerinus]MBM7830863.1 RimJ/RimL family protein N-acetyltransferase [Agromyces cerinus]
MSERPVFRLPFKFEESLTERLRLRTMREADLGDILAYQSRADVCEYLLYEPRDRETLAARIAKWSEQSTLASDGDFLELAVEHRSDARVIGDLYFMLERAEHGCAAIGWAFHPGYSGQGYATEAAMQVLRLGFDSIGLHRIVAEVDPLNAASVALCRRLGMRKEAHLVGNIWFKGRWADTDVYALAETEWRDRPDATPPPSA